MEDSTVNNQSLSRITILCTFLCLISLVGIFYLNKKISKKESILIDYNNKLKQLEKTNNEIQNEIDNLQKTKDRINNLEIEVKNNKEDFYSKALLLERKVYYEESSVKIAYLTIDDGPNKSTTYDYLRILEENNILATFFVNKKNNLDNQYLAIINHGHTLANHTASHDIFGSRGIYQNPDRFIEDLKINEEFIESNYHYHMSIIRFPGGSTEPRYLKQDMMEYRKKVEDNGYGWIDWNISSGDGNRKQQPNTFLNNVLKGASNKKIAIILMHDDSINTIKALPDIIRNLKERGFIFLPLQYNSLMVNKKSSN